MILAGTGHRPDKIGGSAQQDALFRIIVEKLEELKPKKVISGMALGYDQILAYATLLLKIPLIAAVPCFDQDKLWSESESSGYRFLLSRAKDVVIVSPRTYDSEVMQIRNMWMVDKCDKLLAFYDGSAGGTRNCFLYAANLKHKEVEVINLYPEWKKVNG